MRHSGILFTFLLLFATGCNNNESETVVDLGKPRIELNGEKVDTAYLFAEYKDPGASFFEDKNGEKNCYDYGVVTEIEGVVNTNLPGTYYLTYHAKDTLGNAMTPVTRTVVVVENAASFLNGEYTVACTCTAIPQGSTSAVTTENYTAVVMPESENHHFKIVALNLGLSKLIPNSVLIGDSIELGFFSPEYTYYNNECKGQVDPSGNSFTVQTTTQLYSPKTKFKCTNVFKKMVAINRSH